MMLFFFFDQNQVVRTKFDIYVFITVTVDISAGELLVSGCIIRQLVNGLDIYAFITINIHGDRMLHRITYIHLHVYLPIYKY